MIRCTFISNAYFPLEEDRTDRADGYFLKYRLHCWNCWSLEHVLMQREIVRMRKVNSNGSYTSAVTVHNITFRYFWANFKGSFYAGKLSSKVRLQVAAENDCSFRVKENETFELPKISSTLWFRSIGEAFGCFRYISFRLRGSLDEEWSNKRTTDRTRISPSLFFLR